MVNKMSSCHQFLKKKTIILSVLLIVSLLPDFGWTISQTKTLTIYDLYKNYRMTNNSERLEDLEIMSIAFVLEGQGDNELARKYKQYLCSFFKESSLLPYCTDIFSNTSFMTTFDPEPLYSRLIRDSYLCFKDNQDNLADDYFEQLSFLIISLLSNNHDHTRRELEDFLEKYPGSLFSGWVIYYLAWDTRNQMRSERFRRIWEQQPDHPVGKESYAAMEISEYSPGEISIMSALIPGWGEEILEPGMREAAGQMYSEVLYLAGMIGFAVAAQQQSRTENLTGVLILGNFLLLNHRASAERAFFMAKRRNHAEQKKFQRYHFKNNLIEKGRFHYEKIDDNENEVINEQRFKLGFYYHLAGMTNSLLKKGWIIDNSIHNIGIHSAYDMSLGSTGNDFYQMQVSISPHLGIFLNRLKDNPDDIFLNKDGYHTEITGSFNLIFSNRFKLDPETVLYINLQLGEGYRQRKLELGQIDHESGEIITAGGMTLGISGASGHFWEAGITADDSFMQKKVVLSDTEFTFPSDTWKLSFNIGVRF